MSNKQQQNIDKSAEKGNGFKTFFQSLWYLFLILISLGFVGGFFVLGTGAGYFASLVKDEPIRSYETMKKDLYDYEKTSKIYFANNTYFGDIRSDLHREKISLKDVPKTMTEAVIATEDEQFYTHSGIVPKSIVRAGIQEVTSSSVRTGGSTLTQQLIKNQILTNEVSFDRKAKEILLALRVESFFSKDEILEAYLNVIPYGREASGRNIAGVKTAANGVFGKEPKDLNLAQTAYLAGLPQSPSYYTPYTQNGEIKDPAGLEPGLKRMHYVLNRMYNTGYITEKERTEALQYDVTKDFLKKSQLPREKSPGFAYEVELRAKEILLEQKAKEDGIKLADLKKDKELYTKYKELADNTLRQKGYRIHTTIDHDLYYKLEQVAKDFNDYGPDKPQTVVDSTTGKEKQINEPVQAGTIMIENKTGKILSFVASRGFSEDSQLNYATRTERPNGSTMKPLLDYAPAMEKGVIQPGSVIADIPKSFGPQGWRPGNYGGRTNGIVTARTALAKSYNIPAAEIYSKIVHQDPAKEYLEKMGFTSLTEGDHVNLSPSLGQLDIGVTLEENTNAYTTFANSGQFVDAYMIEKITTDDGKVVYEHKKKAVDVFSPQTAYLTIDMMRDVLNNGTATYARSHLKHGGVDWAGKTGTSQDYKDAWFVATNPNVTVGTWMGYDTPKSLQCSSCSSTYSQRNLKLWSAFVNSAGDYNPELFVPKTRFKQPNGIVSRSFCGVSGLLPSDACSKAGLVQSDIFNAKFVPTKVDDSLVAGGNIVKVDGKTVPAGPKTPKEFITGKGFGFNPDFLKRNGYSRLGDLSILYPQTNREAWEKIGVSAASLSTSAIKDPGKAPGAPKGVSLSGKSLTWGNPGTGAIVGYRIYQISGNKDYKRVGHTTGTSFNVPNEHAGYIVKAVDYFGRESGSSNVIEPHEKPADKEKNEDPDKDKNDDSKEKDKNKDNDQSKDDKQPDQNTPKQEEQNKPANGQQPEQPKQDPAKPDATAPKEQE